MKKLILSLALLTSVTGIKAIELTDLLPLAEPIYDLVSKHSDHALDLASKIAPYAGDILKKIVDNKEAIATAVITKDINKAREIFGAYTGDINAIINILLTQENLAKLQTIFNTLKNNEILMAFIKEKADTLKEFGITGERINNFAQSGYIEEFFKILRDHMDAIKWYVADVMSQVAAK